MAAELCFKRASEVRQVSERTIDTAYVMPHSSDWKKSISTEHVEMRATRVGLPHLLRHCYGWVRGLVA